MTSSFNIDINLVDLTFHIDYYLAGVSNVLKGKGLDIRDKFSFDYPPVKSEQEWRILVNKFCNDAEEFIQLVEKMSDKKILSDFVENNMGVI